MYFRSFGERHSLRILRNPSKFTPSCSPPFSASVVVRRTCGCFRCVLSRANTRLRILDSKGIARKVRRPKSRQVDNSRRTRLSTYVHARSHPPTRARTHVCVVYSCAHARAPASYVHRDFALNAELDPAERKPSRANNDSDSNGVLQSWVRDHLCVCVHTRTRVRNTRVCILPGLAPVSPLRYYLHRLSRCEPFRPF